jgi:HAE1 family hydrophobic/amphiphilic exporter-1
MFYFGVALLGIISYARLPQELFPPINYPRLSILTQYANAAPEEIETLITRPIEEAVGAVGNMRGITSVSKEGTSIVTVSFNWGTNMDFASLNVREKLDMIKDRFPNESEDPVVIKFNPFDLPILRFSVTGELDPYELRKLSRSILKDGLEKVEGVASVSISGGLTREILVEVDQGRLQASGISINSVVNALDQTNLNYPAGTIKDQTYEYLIRTIGEYQHVREIGYTPVTIDKRIGTSDDSSPMLEPLPPSERQTMSYQRKEEETKSKRRENRLVLLREIADIKDTFKKTTSYSRLNGKSDISVTIQKQSATNTINVVRNVLNELKFLREDFPPGMRLEIIYDQSEFISQSINGVRNAAVQGGLLAFLVILFFLRNMRSAMIVTFAIPISVMGTFIMMYFKGEIFQPMSLNMMSLGGLALAVGMLVDNAIVVIENIFRYREMGYSPVDSAVQGTNEVTSAITSSTFTTVAVFFPLIFVPGLAGQIFKDLAFTVCFGLVASLAVAVSLIPLLATKIKMKNKKQAQSLDAIKEKLFFLKKGRRRGVYFFFIMALVSVFFVMSAMLMLNIDRELLPKVDQGQFLIKADMPTGSKLEITNEAVSKIEQYILRMPETKSLAVSIGSDQEAAREQAEINILESHQGELLVTLKENRALSTEQIIQNIKVGITNMDLGDLKVQYVLQESVFKSLMGTDSPVVVQLSGYSLDVLNEMTEQVQTGLNRIKGIYGVKSTRSLSNPETKITIIKDQAATYGVSVDQIAIAAHTALKGTVATKFKEEGREYDIRVQLREEDRKDFLNIRELLIKSDLLDVTVPLKQVAVITRGYGPSEIKRIDQERTVLVTANIFGRDLKDVSEDVQNMVDNMVPKLQDGYQMKLAGENKEIKESFNNLFMALALSILLVYMVMASQFESFIQPFIIMFTVPLSLIGIAVALYATQTPVSVVVMLGVIMLGGIVVNNGIVLIEFINLLRTQGYSALEAAFLASRIRLRPIMMSALTTIIGLIPLAVGLEEGSELRSPMAITVMGGLTTSTFLTLFIIPIVYYYVESIKASFQRVFANRLAKDNGTAS